MIGRILGCVVLLLGLWNFVPAAWAQGAEISVEVNRRELAVGESLRVVIKLINLGKAALDPELPDGFEIEGRSSQTSLSMSFGQDTQSTVSQILSARAVKAGKYDIGPFRVEVGGKTFASNVVSVAVRPEGSAPPSGKASEALKPVFLTSEISSKNPWQHERIELVIRFFYRGAVANPKLSEGDLSAFDLYEDKNARQTEYQTTVQGVSYNVVELRKRLAPRTAGTVVVPASRIAVDVRLPREGRKSDPRDPFSAFDEMFDDPFSAGPTQRVSVSSEAIALEVKPLPEPRPADAVPVVGEVKLSHELSKAELTVGESATLTVRLEGKADLAAMQLPELKAEGLKVYPDKPQLERRFEPDGEVVDVRIFKMGIVPVRPGSFALPELAFSYFHTPTGRYERLAVPSLHLNVTGGGEERGAEPPASVSKREVKVQGSDILPLKDALSEVARDERVGARSLLAWFSVPFVLLLGWLASVAQGALAARRGAVDVEARARRAFSQWRKRKTALLERLGHEKDSLGSLYGDFALTVRNFVGERGGTNGTAMTSEEIARFLRDRGIAEPLAQGLKEKLAHAEMCQFVAAAGSREDFRGLAEETEPLIRSIDKEWAWEPFG